MDIRELKIKLEKEPLLKGKYSIDRVENARHCLICDCDEWLVFYYKDGIKHNLYSFTNEEDACIYFYEHMIGTRRFPSGKCDCIS